MNVLDELIRNLCPCGIEHLPIKSVFQRLKGTPITAAKMKEIENPDGEIRIFAGGKTVINATEDSIPNANITRVPAVLVQSRGVIDVVYYEKPFTFKNEMWAYTHSSKTAVKYLYYVLKNNIQHFRDAASGMGSLPQISLSVTEDFIIPVPPLEIQREIVRVLDKFTMLSAELSAELSARQKQYTWYRNSILNFSINVPIKTIGEICSLSAGGDLPKDHFSKQPTDKYTIPVYSNGVGENALYGFTDIVKVKAPAITVAARGTIGYCELRKIDFFPIVRLICLRPNQTVLPSYLKYCIDTIQFQVPTSGIPQLTVPMISKYKVPVPPLDVQQRIVNVLDNFDAICSDLNIGLPAEISARQKQYEYYRDLLLSFKNIDNITDRQTDRQTEHN